MNREKQDSAYDMPGFRVIYRGPTPQQCWTPAVCSVSTITSATLIRAMAFIQRLEHN